MKAIPKNDFKKLLDYIDRLPETDRRAVWCKQRDALLFRMLYYYGMRVSEAVELPIDNIRGGSILIRGKKHGNYQAYSTACIADRLDKWLAVRPDSPWLFPARGTPEKHISRQAVNSRMMEYGLACGVDRKWLHPHSIRHRTGVELADSGCSIIEIMSVLRHKTPMQSIEYSRNSAEYTREVQSKLKIGK